MGSFLFRWNHPAKDVHVTGTFDDWSKSVKLDKKDGYFEKLVELPHADKKIYYKFVIDGDNWTTDHTAPQETDEAKNVNNFLLPENITQSKSMPGGIGGAAISGVTPGSTTTQLAAGVPKEPSHGRNESALSDATGTHPETPFHDAQEFSVNPIPASTGAGNPISLKPGEKVPHPSTISENTVNSGVTLDKASYDSSGASTSQQSSGTAGGMFGVLPVGKGVIPESSIPMGADVPSEKDMGPMIQSAGAGTSTAALAAKVPKEPRGVPQVVSESQHEAGVGPEASGNREAVREKTAMEKELESKVPEEPATSDSAAVGGAARIPPSVQQSIDSMNKGVPIAPTVPDVVQESIADSHTAPEAASSSAMVGEKAAMENELLKDVKTVDSAGEPAPSSSAAMIDTVPAATGSTSAPVTTAAAPAQTPVGQSAMAQAVKEQQPESRDISPMSHPAGAGQGHPTVTTGVGSSTTPSQSTAAGASASSPVSKSSAGAGTDKKSKRSSGFFGKIKEKLKHHDK